MLGGGAPLRGEPATQERPSQEGARQGRLQRSGGAQLAPALASLRDVLSEQEWRRLRRQLRERGSSDDLYSFVVGAAVTEDKKITASDGDVDDFFGESLAISGDTVVVGAPFDDEDAEDGDTNRG